MPDPSACDPEDDIGLKLRRARAGFTGQSDMLILDYFGDVDTYDGLIALLPDIQIVDAGFGSSLAGVPLWVTTGVQNTGVS